MTDKEEIERWLATLPEGTGVGIDDGGLTLVTEDGAYLEVGGVDSKD